MNNYYQSPDMMPGKMEELNKMENHNDNQMMEMDQGMCMDPCAPQMCCEPVYECPQERVCHRYINYEVPHD